MTLFAPAIAMAQGLLVVTDANQSVRLPRPNVGPVPRPEPGAYAIKELDVRARIVDQVAQVQVSQTFVNTGSTQLEAAFVFPLPYDGAIDRMTLLVDGKEHAAKLLDAAEARRLYEEIVRKNRDPALLEWYGTGMFKTTVFPIPAGATRKVTLAYSQLCRRDHQATDWLFPLSTAKYTAAPVETLRIEAAIESTGDIKNVYSPTQAIQITRPDSHHANASYTATNQVPTEDFRLFYDVDAQTLGTTVLSYRPEADEEGYFLLLASPALPSDGSAPQAKTVVFVADRSGSMSGEKIEQAKGALRFVLNNLAEGDLFNIIAYDSTVESFRPELQRYSPETRQAALAFVDRLYSGGSTNIDAALRTALGQLTDSARPSYVIFLTDGLPTEGEQNESRIVAAAKQANAVRARLFAFGVGYDVNSRLLDRLTEANFGQSQYVRPNENIEAHVSKLYSRIGSPVMTDVEIQFALDASGPENQSAVNRVYPRDVHDLFAGEPLVLVGRYRTPGAAKVTVRGSVGGKPQTFEYSAQLTERSADQTYAFVEKLWAVRRVGEILDEIDLKGKNDELVKELVELSTRHGILTPYTAFLADERTNLHDVAQNATEARGRLDLLERESGVSGFSQRRAKLMLKNAAQAPAAAAATFADADADRQITVETVCNVGNQSFFRRGSRWVASTLTAEAEKNAIRVVQFSREYFDLAAQHGRAISQCLAFDEPVLMDVAGQCYLIEPPK